jgi:signal transduction histidine kinase
LADTLTSAAHLALVSLPSMPSRIQFSTRCVEEGALTRSALLRYATNGAEMGELVERNLHLAEEIIGHFKQMAVDQTSEHRRQFLLSDVVSDTLFALSPRLRASGHIIELVLDDGIRLDSYPGAISQVLTNLVINALVHGFEGRQNGRMQLHGHLSTDRKAVDIVFSDDGVGIRQENLKRVFDPFFTTRMGQGGTGLGMHLVHNLVTAVLGGKINLHSTPGAGTEICMSVPLQVDGLGVQLHGAPRDPAGPIG